MNESPKTGRVPALPNFAGPLGTDGYFIRSASIAGNGETVVAHVMHAPGRDHAPMLSAPRRLSLREWIVAAFRGAR
jgi:hypothetical protein